MVRGEAFLGVGLLLMACSGGASPVPERSDLAALAPDLAPPVDLSDAPADLTIPRADLVQPTLIFEFPRTPPGACGPLWLMDFQSFPSGINCGQLLACAGTFPAGSAVRIYELFRCGGMRLDHWTGVCAGTKGGICNTFMGSGTTYAGVDLVIEGQLTVRNSSGVELRVSDSLGVNGPCQSGFGGFNVPNRCNANPCCLTADLGTTHTLHTAAPVRWGGACSGISQDCQVTITGLLEVTAVAP